ncbi:hypothetical protein ACH6CV_11520 [Bacillota bacterium Meth-B3]|nr:hypothetical protein [Christensenellaceae bacterium]MEA5064628.1 hypothetical protein [Eubacteriales bacterium]
MSNRDRDYDEDVFSLDEDLAREKRRQWIQYLVVAFGAAVVVSLALYGSIVLTNNRLAQRQSAQVEPAVPEGGEQPGRQPGGPSPASTDFWPSELFPTIPVLESAAYDTRTEPGYAEIKVPSQTAKGFDDYIAGLTDKGASVYTRTPRLSVLMFEGVEVHLIASNQGNRVVLANEPAQSWSEPSYSAFPLPAAGRMVSVKDGVSSLSRVLTYRGATTLDALEYAGNLTADGWTISGSLEPTNNIFMAVYKKNNLQITIDYFSSGDNYQVRLDYLN